MNSLCSNSERAEKGGGKGEPRREEIWRYGGVIVLGCLCNQRRKPNSGVTVQKDPGTKCITLHLVKDLHSPVVAPFDIGSSYGNVPVFH